MELHNEFKHWKEIPGLTRYIINKDGEIRNKFTKKKIFENKNNRILLMADDGSRVMRTPVKLVKEVFRGDK